MLTMFATSNINPDDLRTFEPQTEEGQIKACIHNLALDAYTKIGYYGGYLESPTDTYIKKDFIFSDYNLDPLNTITNRAETYIEENFKDCITNVKGFNITMDKPEVTITYTTNINVNVKNPASIHKFDATKRITHSSAILNINFKHIHNTATVITEFKKQHPDLEPSITDIKLTIYYPELYQITDNDYDFLMPY